MAGFTEGALVKKLMDLNPSQQSIQTLSLWLIHHRKHHGTIVKVWFREMCKSKDNRKLMFMYLANDVIQNSKKKGPEFGKEFESFLPKAFEHMKGFDEKTRERLNRLLQIWEERGVYEKPQISEFKTALDSVNDPVKEPGSPPPRKKLKVENDKPTKVKLSTPKVDKKERKKSETEVEVDGTKELHVTLSPRTPAGDPPETEELIKALMDLENTASSDAGVRERIASLPPEVSEVSLLANLADRASADQLSIAVNEAAALLADYNGRLQAEMEDRRRLLTMLRDYTLAQRQLLQQAQTTLEDYKEKLKKVCAVRAEVKSHISNLPDLTQLPDVTGGLAPLPSAVAGILSNTRHKWNTNVINDNLQIIQHTINTSSRSCDVYRINKSDPKQIYEASYDSYENEFNNLFAEDVFLMNANAYKCCIGQAHCVV